MFLIKLVFGIGAAVLVAPQVMEAARILTEVSATLSTLPGIQ